MNLRATWIHAASMFALAVSTTVCTATPIPQPPPEILTVGKIKVPDDQPATTGSVRVIGEPDAAPPGSTLRITNLDGENPPVSVAVEDDGSFEVTLGGEFGDEFRFQIRIDDERQEPIDLRYAGNEMVLVERLDCFVVERELALGASTVGTPTSATLVLQNDCDTDATTDPYLLRTGDAAYDLGTPPATVASGTTESFSVTLTPAAAGDTEEIVLIGVLVDGTTLRYPVTMFGTGE